MCLSCLPSQMSIKKHLLLEKSTGLSESELGATQCLRVGHDNIASRKMEDYLDESLDSSNTNVTI